MPHDFKAFPELTNSQMQFYYWDSPHRQITESFMGNVVKVIDGDTIRVKCDFRDFDFPIRLSNIAAPELDEEGGFRSKGFLEQIMDEDVFVIINPANRVEKWGRLLGDITRMGISLNQASMDMGYSVMFGGIE